MSETVDPGNDPQSGLRSECIDWISAHQDRLYALAVNRFPWWLRAKFDLDDVVQSVIHSFLSRPTFPDLGGDLETDLLRILATRVQRKLSDKIRDFETKRGDASLETPQGEASEDQGLGELVAQQKPVDWELELQELDQFLETLPRQEELPIRLRIFAGLTWEQIGDLLETSRDSASRRYRDGIRRLRERYGVPEPGPAEPPR